MTLNELLWPEKYIIKSCREIDTITLGQFRQTFFAKQKVKKIAVSFHQQSKLQISSLNWSTFCQMHFAVPNLCTKKASHPVCA